jgi:hypothetical protein
MPGTAEKLVRVLNWSTMQRRRMGCGVIAPRRWASRPGRFTQRERTTRYQLAKSGLCTDRSIPTPRECKGRGFKENLKGSDIWTSLPSGSSLPAMRWPNLRDQYDNTNSLLVYTLKSWGLGLHSAIGDSGRHPIGYIILQSFSYMDISPRYA